VGVTDFVGNCSSSSDRQRSAAISRPRLAEEGKTAGASRGGAEAIKPAPRNALGRHAFRDERGSRRLAQEARQLPKGGRVGPSSTTMDSIIIARRHDDLRVG